MQRYGHKDVLFQKMEKFRHPTDHIKFAYLSAMSPSNKFVSAFFFLRSVLQKKKTLSTNMQVNFFPYPNLTNGAPALQMRLISKIEDRCDAFAYMQKKRKKTQLNLIMGWLYCTNLAHFLLIDGAVLYNYSVVLPKKGFFFFIESQHIWHMVIANWNGIMP